MYNHKKETVTAHQTYWPVHLPVPGPGPFDSQCGFTFCSETGKHAAVTTIMQLV